MSKRFKEDICEAAEKATIGGIPGVISIERNDGDAILIVLEHQNRQQGIRVVAYAQGNPASYPEGNIFLLCTADDDTPKEVVEVIASFASGIAEGVTVTQIAVALATRVNNKNLRNNETDDSHRAQKPLSSRSDITSNQHDGDSKVMSDSDDEGGTISLSKSFSLEELKFLQQSLRQDIHLAEQEGYKVHIISGFEIEDRFGTISLAKSAHHLGLPAEVLEAWDVLIDDYVVLLVLFEGFYQPLEEVLKQASSTNIRFRFGKCDTDKPSRESVAAAFFGEPTYCQLEIMGGVSGTTFRKNFVSNSLDQFLDQSFVSLLKLREKKRCSWDQANEELLHKAGRIPPTHGGWTRGSKSPVTDQDPHEEDHQLKAGGDSRSFPLISMQFAMRYFVRCTEYCLQCHCRLDEGVQALRPYVCSDPLCLWQYIVLGPEVEHEILTEPYVVDLLVCLCYASITRPNFAFGKPLNPPPPSPGGPYPIREFPTGLRLKVPDLFSPGAMLVQGVLHHGNSIQFSRTSFLAHFRRNMWIAVRQVTDSEDAKQASVTHGIVRSINRQCDSIDFEPMGSSATTWNGVLSNTPQPGDDVNIYSYSLDFDLLDDDNKALAMRHILDTLPAIMDIEFFLSQEYSRTLRSMDAVSPAAESLLRWIVTSNRSCILQVDRCRSVEGKEELMEPQRPAGRGRNREHERIGGIAGWVQFRCAQGVADKERRFNQAIHGVAARKGITSDLTMFAWHGSSLCNWHSILRSGLDFKEVRTGRANGDGVYFSRRFNQSQIYAGTVKDRWPNSDLDVQSVLSLNEIINVPDEFVCSNPHYVVSQLDWHQCRYLFVKTRGASAEQINPKVALSIAGSKDATLDVDTEVLDYYISQPQARKIKGPGNEDLEIPRAALPSRRILVESIPTYTSTAKRNSRRLGYEGAIPRLRGAGDTTKK
eukprot:Nitzschia sp. Nitz4//scaffold67_size101165//20448//23318//NITZ4_004522-RA/size101165-snap-gene-0.10-mRNA-1//-1//CDS//3329556453//4585//frame0